MQDRLRATSKHQEDAPRDGPRAVQLDELTGLPLFEGVDIDVLRTLVTSFVAVRYRANSLLLERGGVPPRLQIICRGIIELCRVDDEGNERGVLLLSGKDLLMPASAILGEPTLVCARALTTTRMVEIDAGLIRSAMPRSSQLAFNLLKVTSGQWRMAVRSILDLTLRTAAQRLGAFLLRLADLQPDDPAPLLPIAKRHLAARLGITPETLSRTLQTLAEHGLHLRGRCIIVNDRSAIGRFCGPDPYDRPDERPLDVFAF